MTDDMMNLRALVAKTPDADLLREMIGFAAERLMELGVGAVTGAAYGERSTGPISRPSGGRSARSTALPLDRRHLPQGPARWACWIRRRDHRRGRQHRWSPRGFGNGNRHFRGRADLDRVPAQADPAGSAGRQTGDLGRTGGHQGGRHQGALLHLAALPPSSGKQSPRLFSFPPQLHAQRAGPCRKERAQHSPRIQRKPPAPNGGLLPTRSDPRCQSSPRSWTRPSPTCWPT